jgi:hypothetical protein
MRALARVHVLKSGQAFKHGGQTHAEEARLRARGESRAGTRALPQGAPAHLLVEEGGVAAARQRRAVLLEAADDARRALRCGVCAGVGRGADRALLAGVCACLGARAAGLGAAARGGAPRGEVRGRGSGPQRAAWRAHAGAPANSRHPLLRPFSPPTRPPAARRCSSSCGPPGTRRPGRRRSGCPGTRASSGGAPAAAAAAAGEGGTARLGKS